MNTMTKLGGALLAASLALGHCALASAQAVYPSPDAAADALVNALSTGDRDGVRHVLGEQFMNYVPDHNVAADDVYAFLEAWSKSHAIESDTPTSSALVVGDSKWRFPAPIVKSQRGWQFDLRAGRQEMMIRRIGRNELAAIDTLKLLCAAQVKYVQGVGQGKPAARIVSRSGQRDGLYWPTTDAVASPLGPDALVMEPDTPADAALHGYRYRLLPTSDAKGCSFVAWPARYGNDGVNTFAIGSDGVVHEKDLGGSTASAAGRIGASGLTDGWTAVP